MSPPPTVDEYSQYLDERRAALMSKPPADEHHYNAFCISCYKLVHLEPHIWDIANELYAMADDRQMERYLANPNAGRSMCPECRTPSAVPYRANVLALVLREIRIMDPNGALAVANIKKLMNEKKELNKTNRALEHTLTDKDLTIRLMRTALEEAEERVSELEAKLKQAGLNLPGTPRREREVTL